MRKSIYHTDDFFPQHYCSLKRDNEKLLQKHILFLTSISTSTSQEDAEKCEVEKYDKIEIAHMLWRKLLYNLHPFLHT